MINKLIVQNLLRKQENNPALTILAITPANDKTFLLSTNEGVYNYNPLTTEFKHVGMSVTTEPVVETINKVEKQVIAPEVEEIVNDTFTFEEGPFEVKEEILPTESEVKEVVQTFCEEVKETKQKETSFIEKITEKVTGKRGRPKKK